MCRLDDRLVEKVVRRLPEAASRQGDVMRQARRLLGKLGRRLAEELFSIPQARELLGGDPGGRPLRGETL
jgi:hypothetical protein